MPWLEWNPTTSAGKGEWSAELSPCVSSVCKAAKEMDRIQPQETEGTSGLCRSSVQPGVLRLELKKDADVVYAAVQVDGKALKHVRWAPVSASKRIVLEAVLQDARALEYADESLGLGGLGADAAIEVLRAGGADDARRSAEVGRALLRRSISRETS